MKTVSVLKKTVLAAAVAMAPAMAAAEISGTVGAASQYLWRGQQLTDGAAVSGSLDYSHASGLYAGAWASSETDDTEYDLYAGFGGEANGISYDISYIDYNYTAGGTAGGGTASGADFEEVHLGLGFVGVSLDAYIGVGEVGHGDSATDNEDSYYSLGYGYEKVSATVGYYDYDADDSDYIHLDVSYALTDAFSFTVSKIVDEEEEGTYDDDVVMSVAYSFAL